MILFKENDPWHFGTLHDSILTLFRASTLEDWTDIMYINVYGCEYYGYDMSWETPVANRVDTGYIIGDDDDGKGTNKTYVYTTDGLNFGNGCNYSRDAPSALAGAVAAIYFVIFTLLGALVLLTLFIGVICTSMEEATEARAAEDELEDRIKDFANGSGLSEHTIENYRRVFHMLDVDNGGTIEEDELRAGLKSIGRNPTNSQLRMYMRLTG